MPVLVLHPDDDQVIPVEHARMLDEAATGNDLVRVWIAARRAATARSTPWTGSGSTPCTRGFFERWARLRGAGDGAGEDSHADQPPVKLIYSAAR